MKETIQTGQDNVEGATALEDTPQAAVNATEQNDVGEMAIDSDAGLEQQVPTIESLQLALDAARVEAATNLDRTLRATAELDNYRKRADREIENARKYALERFLQELLPVKDSLEMGLVAAGVEGADLDTLREGSELTLKMLNGVVEKHGVVEIDPLGQIFDPEQHQAISMQDAESGVPSGTVISVIQKGYLLHDRLVRPALVMVAK